jgi:hypothetical protein
MFWNLYWHQKKGVVGVTYNSNSSYEVRESHLIVYYYKAELFL